MNNKVAIQLLVGRNEEPFLKAAIQSVSWADYFTVVNTDSTSYWGKENEKIVWETIPEDKLRYEVVDFTDRTFDFAEARNMCLSITDEDDFVFIVDSDDVHFPEWEYQVRSYIEKGYDSITAYYYHLMVYKDIFQFVSPREIIYKNYKGTQWMQGVHEQLVHNKRWPVNADYHYIHYGYIKPQTQVFDRWKFYSDIVGDYHHYDNQDPNNIISDRIAVSKPLPVQHPTVVQPLLESYPLCPHGLLKENWETVAAEKVGLVLLSYNDADNLSTCLSTLALTRNYPEFEVIAIDLGSEDNSVEILESYSKLFNIQVFECGELLPLAETLNFAFNNFRQRHDIQYIGWIHPDMRFDDSDWLLYLWRDLSTNPKIGKICAANTRDNPPTDYIVGHEQCYIIRKEIINKIGLFDEHFIGIGGYEDWDMNRRIMNHEGFKVMISPNAKVFHKGMATRERRDTTADQIHNASYYFQKWQTSDAPC